MNPNKYNTNTKDTTGESNEDAVKSPFKRKINEPTNNDNNRQTNQKSFRKIPLNAVVSSAKIKKSNVGKSSLINKFFSKINETTCENATESNKFSKDNESDQLLLLPDSEASKPKKSESKVSNERRPKTNLNNIDIYKKYITNPNILAFQNQTTEAHKKELSNFKAVASNIRPDSDQANDIPEAFKENDQSPDSLSDISSKINSLEFLKSLADDLLKIPVLEKNPYESYFSLEKTQNELRQVYNMHRDGSKTHNKKCVESQTILLEDENSGLLNQIDKQTLNKDCNNNTCGFNPHSEVKSHDGKESSRFNARDTFTNVNSEQEIKTSHSFFHEPPQARSENFFNRMNFLDLNQCPGQSNNNFQADHFEKGLKPLNIFKNQSDFLQDPTDHDSLACNQNLDIFN